MWKKRLDQKDKVNLKIYYVIPWLTKKSLYEVNASGLQLSFNQFSESSTCQTMKTKYTKLKNIDPERRSILIFQKRVWEQFLHYILFMSFQEKCFSSCILLTDQISLPDCLYFLRYWSICLLQLLVNQVVTSQILKLILCF